MDGLSHPMMPLDDPDDLSTSLSGHGIWSVEFRQMALPSFRPMYLFLVRIPLDVIHECLRLRLEQKPKKDPSAYSIGHVSVVLPHKYYRCTFIDTMAENKYFLCRFEDPLAEKNLNLIICLAKIV